MDDTELQTDILISINPEDHNKEDEMEKQQNEQTNSGINSKDNWTKKDIAFLKLEYDNRFAMTRRLKLRVYCDFCKKSYKNKSSLKSHIRNMHASQTTIKNSEIIYPKD